MIDNGGYAYPRRLPDIKLPPDEAYESVKNHAGKTLLDDFAGLAMQSMLRYFVQTESTLTFEDMAKTSYNAAEAMVKEKRKREK